MKVKVICENCNSNADLVPITVGQISYIQPKLRENNFEVFESDIDNSVSSSPYQDFIEKLVSASNQEQVEEILNNEVDSNVDVESKLLSVRINCKNCGDYIVLDHD